MTWLQIVIGGKQAHVTALGANLLVPLPEAEYRTALDRLMAFAGMVHAGDETAEMVAEIADVPPGALANIYEFCTLLGDRPDLWAYLARSEIGQPVRHMYHWAEVSDAALDMIRRYEAYLHAREHGAELMEAPEPLLTRVPRENMPERPERLGSRYLLLARSNGEAPLVRTGFGLPSWGPYRWRGMQFHAVGFWRLVDWTPKYATLRFCGAVEAGDQPEECLKSLGVELLD